jgi:hypothetical protein
MHFGPILLHEVGYIGLSEADKTKQGTSIHNLWEEEKLSKEIFQNYNYGNKLTKRTSTSLNSHGTYLTY